MGESEAQRAYRTHQLRPFQRKSMEHLIDYTEVSTEDKPERWSSGAFKKYFMETYWKIHNVGGAVPWTLKEQVLLQRVMTEYKPVDIADMIVYWHTSTRNPGVACRFDNFYSSRVNMFHQMKEAQKGYTWK